MDFGKLENIDDVDFSLPEDDANTTHFLASLPKEEGSPNVYIACPVWTDKGFSGKLFPKSVKQKDFLKHYAQEFNSIELNSTYYRTDTDLIRKWKSVVPENFLFCPKLPQHISHHKQLKNCEAATLQFCESVLEFRENLGPCFLLLPQHFAPNRLDVLEHYLDSFPSHIPLGIELRHPDWFNNVAAKNDVFQLFENTNTISIITDVAGRRDVLHQRITSREVIIRFVGNKLHPTDYTRIDAWLEKFKQWFDEGLQTVYLFMHQPQEHLNVDLCNYFIPKLNQICNTQLSIPGIEKEDVQQSLF